METCQVKKRTDAKTARGLPDEEKGERTNKVMSSRTISKTLEQGTCLMKKRETGPQR